MNVLVPEVYAGIRRHWTLHVASPFDVVEWTTSPVTVKDNRGEIIYHNDGVEHPVNWSSNAVEVCASKYFRRADIPGIGGEHSIRQLAKRVAGCLRKHGQSRGYFTEEEAQAFEDEIIAGFVTQRIGFNSPVWFNYGLYSEYGLVGNQGRRRYYFDHAKGGVEEIREELVRPSGAACYLSGVTDSLFTEGSDGMADLLVNQQKIFLTGAGDGNNISNIRGRGEPISGGGRSAGLISFLKVRDANAGYIRSGGKTRRSATLLCCDLDHPDIVDFIEWKDREEQKAWTLIEQGYSGGMDGDAYSTISGQNSNNSVRVPDSFMEAVEADEDWYLISRLALDRFAEGQNVTLGRPRKVRQGDLWLDESGKPFALRKTGEEMVRRVMHVVNSRELWQRTCDSAWKCGCPGIQFDDTINRWNSVPHYGRINTTNPCSEICLPDWSVCNLGSVNLMKFFSDLENPDWEGFEHACRIMTIALDLVVDLSSYPTEKHAEGSAKIRSIGLNHGNIGAVLMRNGLAYDSEEARFWMGIVTSMMTLFSTRASMELARQMGAYPVFDYANHRDILQMHRDGLAELLSDRAMVERFRSLDVETLRSLWSTIIESEQLREYGMRNNTLTTLVPQGTIGLVLDQDTLGCEPDFCIVKYKRLSGGGGMLIVNQSVIPALKRLGYSDEQIAEICGYIETFSTVEGCSAIKPEHVAIFDTAVKPANSIELRAGLSLKNPNDLSEALNLIVGAKSREEAVQKLTPSLEYLAPYVKVFTRVISVEGHVRALGAFQPHISHSISKTCNMNNEASVEDISRAYRLAWQLGVKCIAIYRDGSKKAQPLSAGKASQESTYGKKEAVAEKQRAKGGWSPEDWPAVKRKTPRHTSNCDLFHFKIADPTEPQGVFVNVALYPDSNDLMAIFVNTGRQGETTNGLVHSLARVISCALQFGVPPEEIGEKLAGMAFPPHGFLGDSSAFGIHRAKSISDLIGRLLMALPEYFRGGRDEDVMFPKFDNHAGSALSQEVLANGDNTKSIGPHNARQYGFTGKQCQNCGSYKTVGGPECHVCRDCGHNNGPCFS
jgi:ribonucleoside-diphosphate reductase alpha chain